jgi:hypothetical protein
MPQPTLSQRRLWFRYFPEGSIEFTIITRVLIFLGLLASASVGTERIRYYFLVATCGALWLDYALTLWWLIQVHADLRQFEPSEQADASRSVPSRAWTLIISLIPSIIFFLIITPWPLLLVGSFETRGMIYRFVLPILALALIAAIVLAQKVLQRIEVKPALWRFLILVPIIHWLALNRLIFVLHRKISQKSGLQTGEINEDAPHTAVVLADITVPLAIFLWMIPLALWISRGVWPGHPLITILPIGGTIFLSVALIAELAAMEHVQNRFHKWLEKL